MRETWVVRGIRERSPRTGVPATVVRVASGVGGALLVAASLVACYHLVRNSPERAIDYRSGIWQPAVDILHGRSP
jgi:hypothetical protein